MIKARRLTGSPLIWRAALFSTLAGIAESALGRFMTIRAHGRYLNSLDDPDGYVKAIPETQIKLGAFYTPHASLLVSLWKGACFSAWSHIPSYSVIHSSMRIGSDNSVVDASRHYSAIDS